MKRQALYNHTINQKLIKPSRGISKETLKTSRVWFVLIRTP